MSPLDEKNEPQLLGASASMLIVLQIWWNS